MKFKTLPKTFQDIDQEEYQIVALEGKVIQMPLTLDDESFSFLLYIAFLDVNGRARSEKNADRADLLKKLVPAIRQADPTISQEAATADANAQINQLIAGILLGSKQQRYQAAQQLALSYQFTLRRLEDQDSLIGPEVPAAV